MPGRGPSAPPPWRLAPPRWARWLSIPTKASGTSTNSSPRASRSSRLVSGPRQRAVAGSMTHSGVACPTLGPGPPGPWALLWLWGTLPVLLQVLSPWGSASSTAPLRGGPPWPATPSTTTCNTTRVPSAGPCPRRATCPCAVSPRAGPVLLGPWLQGQPGPPRSNLPGGGFKAAGQCKRGSRPGKAAPFSGRSAVLSCLCCRRGGRSRGGGPGSTGRTHRQEPGPDVCA